MDDPKERLLESVRRHLAVAREAKAAGWISKGDLYDYSMRAAEEDLGRLEEIIYTPQG